MDCVHLQTNVHNKQTVAKVNKKILEAAGEENYTSVNILQNLIKETASLYPLFYEKPVKFWSLVQYFYIF